MAAAARRAGAALLVAGEPRRLPRRREHRPRVRLLGRPARDRVAALERLWRVDGHRRRPLSVLYWLGGLWEEWELSAFSINVLELAAENMGTFAFVAQARALGLDLAHSLDLFDNTAAEYPADRGTPRAPGMQELVRRRFAALDELKIYSSVERITALPPLTTRGLTRSREARSACKTCCVWRRRSACARTVFNQRRSGGASPACRGSTPDPVQCHEGGSPRDTVVRRDVRRHSRRRRRGAAWTAAALSRCGHLTQPRLACLYLATVSGTPCGSGGTTEQGPYVCNPPALDVCILTSTPQACVCYSRR